jgi:hypothetical protein
MAQLQNPGLMSKYIGLIDRYISTLMSSTTKCNIVATRKPDMQTREDRA